MFKIKNILLPTDFSKLSLSAADYAIELAKQYNAKIHLLHILEKTPPILAIRSLDLSEEKVIKTIEADTRKQLDETLKKITEKNEVEIEAVLKKGTDYEEIVKYARENKIDLIVIATHGRTGFLQSLIGSVTEKVVRLSTVPVLITTTSTRAK